MNKYKILAVMGQAGAGKDSFVDAVNEAISPYVSLLVGFDAQGLVDLLFEAALQDESLDEKGRASFTYEVNDDDKEVYITFNEGGQDKLIMNEDGDLEFEGEIMGSRMVFSK